MAFYSEWIHRVAILVTPLSLPSTSNGLYEIFMHCILVSSHCLRWPFNFYRFRNFICFGVLSSVCVQHHLTAKQFFHQWPPAELLYIPEEIRLWQCFPAQTSNAIIPIISTFSLAKWINFVFELHNQFFDSAEFIRNWQSSYGYSPGFTNHVTCFLKDR